MFCSFGTSTDASAPMVLSFIERLTVTVMVKMYAAKFSMLYCYILDSATFLIQLISYYMQIPLEGVCKPNTVQ